MLGTMSRRINDGSRQGFTLIELLVVIAIIAILAAILFPVFITAKSMAKRTKCQSNLKQLAEAGLMYADDYDGWTPPPIYYFVEWGSSLWNGVKGWTEGVAPYVKQHHGSAPKKGESKVYVCPEQLFNYSYGINWWGPPDADRNEKGFHVGTVVRPTKMVFIFDLRPHYSDDPKEWMDSMMRDSGLSNDTQPDAKVYYRFPGRQDNTSAPYWLSWPGVHNGGNNIAFSDGHVRWFKDWDDNKMTFYGTEY